MFTYTRVSRSLRLWNVMTPTISGPPVLRQTMRSFGVCSTISASQERRTPQMFSCHMSVESSFCSTFSTRCMKFGNSSNCVYWSYATSIGTATSTNSWTGRRRPRP